MSTQTIPAIDQLIVIAGPSASGKTTLINLIRAGGNVELSRQLGILDPASWSFTTARELERGEAPYTPQLLIHFDLWGKKNASRLFHLSYPDDERLQLLGRARELTFLTLWTPRRVLAQRLMLRTIRGMAHPAMMRQWIRSNARVVYRMTKWGETYEAWFRFCQSFQPKARWIADSSGGVVRLRPQSDWPQLTGWSDPSIGVATGVSDVTQASPDRS
jgi:hypothetical protein